MKVWLDDVRPAPEGWIWAKNVAEVELTFGWGVITHLSLDHDLGDDEATGYDLVKWMAEHDVWPTEWIGIHSMNPVGRDNMKAIINRYSPFTLY